MNGAQIIFDVPLTHPRNDRIDAFVAKVASLKQQAREWVDFSANPAQENKIRR